MGGNVNLERCFKKKKVLFLQMVIFSRGQYVAKRVLFFLQKSNIAVANMEFNQRLEYFAVKLLQYFYNYIIFFDSVRPFIPFIKMLIAYIYQSLSSINGITVYISYITLYIVEPHVKISH